MRKIRGKLTFSNVIACLALFVALGGVSYAAMRLPKNSVGSKQIKKGAVTATKLSASIKKTFAGAVGPQGKEGPAGPQGPGAVSFEALAPESFSVLRTFNGVSIKGLCEPGDASIALEATGGGVLDATGTANTFTSEEITVPFDSIGASSIAQGSGTGSQVGVSAVARNTTVSKAFGRFDLHLDTVTCILRGMYTPSTIG